MKIDFLGNQTNLLPELAQLHHDEWKHLNPSLTLDGRIEKLEKMSRSGDVPFVVVATDNNQLVGSAALVLEDMRTRKDLSPWLASVFVKPEFRKRGIGTCLVRYIEDQARQRGIAKLFLYTEHARDLYAKLAWRDLEACDYQGVEVVIMSKEFPA